MEKRLGSVMSDSTRSVVSRKEIVVAEDGLGSGSESVRDSALDLDLKLGFERAIAVSSYQD